MKLDIGYTWIHMDTSYVCGLAHSPSFISRKSMYSIYLHGRLTYSSYRICSHAGTQGRCYIVASRPISLHSLPLACAAFGV